MTISRQLSLVCGLVAMLGTASAGADSWKAMPSLDKDSKHLKVRWKKYNGGTNGSMVIQVKNTAAKTVKFDPDGLFFVPAGDPEKAPQRLGASGPLQIAKGKGFSAHKEHAMLAPGETKTVALDVFCIDSHRSSPGSTTQFSVAAKRLPKKLRSELKTTNAKIYRANKNDYKKSKSAIQSNMWKTRDKAWIELEGERAVEKPARAPRQHRRRKIYRQRRD